MSKDRHIDRFEPDRISLHLWLSLLEAHFQYTGITGNSEEDLVKKKNLLLVSVGSVVYAELGRICAPDLPHTKSFSDLVKALKQYYIVTPSYHTSLVAFQQRKKWPGESLNNLYAELKALAKDCNFADQFDNRVRDQLFMAVDNESYFPNLVAENFKLQTLTSQETFDRILNMEQAFVGENNSIRAVSESQNLHKKKGSRHDPKTSSYYQSVCRFKDSTFEKKSKGKGIAAVNRLEDSSDSDSADNNLFVVKSDVFSVKSELVNFKINDNLIPFEIDTGACVSTLSENWVHSLKLSMSPSNKVLRAYGHIAIDVLGKVDVTVLYNNYVLEHTFCVVVASGNINLCGKDLQKKVGISLAGIPDASRVSRVNNIVNASTLLDEYTVDLTKPITSVKAAIHLKPEAVPKCYKTRTVSFHFRKLVEDELDNLVKEGIISPVEFSEWAAPIVPVLKQDQKSVCICADFKYLNQFLLVDQYPLPKVDELLSVVGKGQLFSKLDLKNAYPQMAVDGSEILSD
ncbi:uncharacterized protein LOC143035931 [Oratosquilla oratoria]|uniref:uncharacterized protein LOC143035931 n=1 Tax=Oratosquilla oratoria TaxID=337810 RepID=UPI003F767566